MNDGDASNSGWTNNNCINFLFYYHQHVMRAKHVKINTHTQTYLNYNVKCKQQTNIRNHQMRSYVYICLTIWEQIKFPAIDLCVPQKVTQLVNIREKNVSLSTEKWPTEKNMYQTIKFSALSQQNKIWSTFFSFAFDYLSIFSMYLSNDLFSFVLWMFHILLAIMCVCLCIQCSVQPRNTDRMKVRR